MGLVFHSFPMHSFCWLSCIQPIVLISFLSQLLTFHNTIGVSLAFTTTNKLISNHTSNDVIVWSSIWSSIPGSTHKSSALRTRSKRDETEDPGRAYGRGVGFFVGEPCVSTCNQILFHVSCNLSTHLCECLPDYPVNVDNKICLRAVSVGEKCEYQEECSHSDPKSVCSGEGYCQCSEGYDIKPEDKKGKICSAGDSPMHLRIGTATYDFIHNADLTTILSLIFSVVMIIFLFCFVIKLFNKERYNDGQERCYSRGSVPPVILTGLETSHSRDSSSRSVTNEYLPPSRRASYSLLAPPPSNLASRRPSLSSIRSQSSLRSYSSFRSQSSFRNYRPSIGVRDTFPRTTTSSVDPMQQILSNSSFNADPIAQNHYSANLRNKNETCLIHHSSGINPSVPHH